MRRFSVLLLILLPITIVAGEQRSVVQKKGPAELRFDAEPTLLLSDTIRVELVVEGSSALVVNMPTEMPAGSKWTLVERTLPTEESLNGDRKRWSVTCRFGPREPGEKVEFHFPDITIKENKDDRTITFAPRDFKVTTAIKTPDISQLRDITAIEPLPKLVPNHAWLGWLALGLSAIVVILLVLIVWFVPGVSATTSAADVALRELHRLVAMNLPEKAKTERFVTLLTTVVRQYLERQYALPARRQTTPEFVEHLTQVTALTDDDRRFLISFLERCDAVKFAQGPMSPAECHQWAESVQQFLKRHVAQTAQVARAR